MGWFTRKREPEAPPPDPRAGRLGPEPALPRTAETPGVSLAPAGDASTIAALFGLPPDATDLLVAAALQGTGAAAPVPGITGLRILHRDAQRTILRLGPPPGARWAFRGVSALAVFSGKIVLMDGEEPVVVRAGSLARLARPAATLFVEAGNDSALALAVAGAGFAATLA